MTTPTTFEAFRQVNYALSDLQRAVAFAKDEGFEEGFARGRQHAGLNAPTEPAIVLRRIAGWVNAMQLPVDGPHAAEAATRRRLVVLLHDLAGRVDAGEWGIEPTREALNSTAESS